MKQREFIFYVKFFVTVTVVDAKLKSSLVGRSKTPHANHEAAMFGFLIYPGINGGALKF